MTITFLSGCVKKVQDTDKLNSAKQTAKINALINNPQSMTKLLEKINPNLTVSVLSNDIQIHNNQQYYERNIALNLEHTPVLVATSSTALSNSMFLNILQSSGTTPIGNTIFATKSLIKRNPEMHINKIHIYIINNVVLRNYLLDLGYHKNDMVIMRQSCFCYNKETMQLIEYILPTINKFIY